MFNQSMYNVDEDVGPAQLVLVLTNPSSSDITVQVITEDGSATGECYSIIYNNNNCCTEMLQEEVLIIHLGHTR